MKTRYLYISFSFWSLCIALFIMSCNTKKAEIPDNFVFVPGGSFNMGDEIGAGNKDDGRNDEKPVHKVIVDPFWISKYEVIQKEWVQVMNNNPSEFKGDSLPVENVSWYDCILYCNIRSKIEGLKPCYIVSMFPGDKENLNEYDNIKWKVSLDKNANGYRLPTEEEWEYAARFKDGSSWTPANYASGAKNKYNDSIAIDGVSWYIINSGYTTHKVGTKRANQLGIYDMSGNVWEWCWDYYKRYPENVDKDPDGYYGEGKKFRVLRGGAWNYENNICRVSNRTGHGGFLKSSHYGLRLVRSSL